MLFLSAGHHPAAPGAAWKGFVEHQEAVKWVTHLARLMPNAMVVPTGDLGRKVAWINARAKKGDLAVEIHFNAATPSAKGSETLFAPGSVQGQAWAGEIQACVSKLFLPNRGTKIGWYQADPAKGPLAFLSKTKCTAVIVEPEFVYWADQIYANRAACCDALAKVLWRAV